MKNESQSQSGKVSSNEPIEKSKAPSALNRRKFVEVMATSALAFSIVPRHVLGGPGFVAPSDTINLAYIGLGTQGIRELLPLLQNTQFRVVAVCDPNQQAVGYRDWAKDWLRNEIRK